MSQPLQTHYLNGKTGRLELLACLPSHAHPAPASARPPLLFVHGAFSGAWIWGDHFLPWFARAGYPAYALSLSGHGNSAGREQIEWLSINHYVDDLMVAVDWLHQQTGQVPVLVGHSMGGFVIQKLLEQRQAPAVALLCSVPPQGLLAAQFHMLMRKPGLFLEINRLMSGQLNDLEIIREALFAQPVETATLQRFFLHMQPESQRAIWDMSSLFNLPHLNNANLPPLLVLGAEEDALVPAFLVRATARTYGVEARIFPGFGHGITHERDWPQIAAALLGWLEVLPCSGTS